MIGPFTEQYRWLSNFHHCKILYEEIEYPSVEHAYQAAKTLNPAIRKHISHLLTPGAAKRYGKKLTLKPNWNEVKTSVMKGLIRIKFQDESLRRLLLATGDEELVEVNTWGDRFWGKVHGAGYNHLGIILMAVREELKVS